MFYVSMIDSFMSGWGVAEGKKNELIFVCNDLEQAKIVSENAKNRSDQKNICISEYPPVHYKENKKVDEYGGYIIGNYYIQIKNNDDYKRWYEKDGFKKKEIENVY